MYILKYTTKGTYVEDNTLDDMLKNGAHMSLHGFFNKLRFQEAKMKAVGSCDIAQIALGNRVFKTNVHIIPCNIGVESWNYDDKGQYIKNSVDLYFDQMDGLIP